MTHISHSTSALETGVQVSNAGPGLQSGIEESQRSAGGFGGEFPAPNNSQPALPQASQQPPPQQQQSEVIFETDPRSTSENSVNAQYRQYDSTGADSGSPFPSIDEGQPHPFPSTVGAET